MWRGMPKLSNITSITISLQYLEKKVSDEVDFLHLDKHESFLQVYNVIFDWNGQAFPEFPK